MRNEKEIKKEYIKPAIRLVVFDYRDVVMASDGGFPSSGGVGSKNDVEDEESESETAD